MLREKEAEGGRSHRRVLDELSPHSHHPRGVGYAHFPNFDKVWKNWSLVKRDFHPRWLINHNFPFFEEGTAGG